MYSMCVPHYKFYIIILQMSEIVGFELKPKPTTPLKTLVEYGLQKHLDKYVLHFHLSMCVFILLHPCCGTD